MQLVAVATDAALRQLFVTGPDGSTRPLPADASSGPPWSLHGSTQRRAAGAYRIDALRGGQVASCPQVAVGGGPGDRGSGDQDLAISGCASTPSPSPQGPEQGSWAGRPIGEPPLPIRPSSVPSSPAPPESGNTADPGF